MSRFEERSELVELDFYEVLAKTNKAVLLTSMDGREDWWPLSECDGLAELARGDGAGEFSAPLWLVEEKGWDWR